jgi:hypothetical protein
MSNDFWPVVKLLLYLHLNEHPNEFCKLVTLQVVFQ